MKAVRGFSLIELMIAIAIVGVLAAIAIPSYNKSVIKSYRGNAKAFLVEVAQREQQVLMDKRSYVAGDTSSITTNLGVAVPTEFSRYYTLDVTIGAGPPPNFQAKATPIAGKKQVSDGWIQIDQAGTRTSQYPDKW